MTAPQVCRPPRVAWVYLFRSFLRGACRLVGVAALLVLGVPAVIIFLALGLVAIYVLVS